MRKKKAIIIILSVCILGSTVLCACSGMLGSISKETDRSDQEASGDFNRDEALRELEAKIIAILKDQQLSEQESKKEIAELRAEIEELKNAQVTDKETDASAEEPDQSETFKYTVSDGRACITQILSEEKNIVIPYTLDGYTVYSIGSEALSSEKVESIVISSGIERIDWFAFEGCPSLCSVTVPSTVSSIGYGAFDNASADFVIRCARDSFAHRYAKSYGITYDIS